MNYMIKVSHAELTILRKFEIVSAVQKAEKFLREKFASVFENTPNEVDYIELYCTLDIKEIQSQLEETQPKPKPKIDVKVTPKKKEENNEYQLTDEEILKYNLIPEFKSRTKLLKYFRKKTISKYMQYLKGVSLIVNSIYEHGYQVAKIFFLNPIKCTCISKYIPGTTPDDLPKTNNLEENKDQADFLKGLKVTSIERMVHS